MLTKKQKLEAYTYALFCALEIQDCKTLDEYRRSCGSIGVCVNLSHWQSYNKADYDFPEFNSQKPDITIVLGYWWHYPFINHASHQQRIRAIERAINLTEQL